MMGKARDLATKRYLELVGKIYPDKPTLDRIEAMLKGKSDRQFEQFMKDLRDGHQVINLTVPNLSKVKLSVKRNIGVAKELGYDFFQHLSLKDPATGLQITTPEKYMVLRLPVRRQSQHLVKKMSVAEDNDTRDDLTGQPTGKSKSSTLSGPELQVLYALGLDSSIEELIKVRGGDEAAFNMMNKQVESSGTFSLETTAKAGGKVRSTETLSALLKGCHLNNNL